MRPSGRAPNELRAVKLTPEFTCHAEGSVLIEFGNTKVICNASLDSGVPPFLKGSGQGWITAEYGMLPRSTNKRMRREATQNKQGGRTVEIQRLIGRSLRAAVDLKQLGEVTIVIDCDVIQADGGYRRDHRRLCRADAGDQQRSRAQHHQDRAGNQRHRLDLGRHL